MIGKEPRKQREQYTMKKSILAVLAAGAMVAHAQPAPETPAADKAAELAKKLANPVAALISVPLQYNYDEYGGANDGASTSARAAKSPPPPSVFPW